MKQLLTVVVAAALLLTSLLGGRVVLADDTPCTGFLGAVTVDNLVVPQNASCTLDGTMVEGTIYVENGASLTAWRVRVDGNVQAEGAELVRVLTGSTVGGSIQLKQGGAARVDKVDVDGDIQYESNAGAFSVTRNDVGGNIQIFQNTGGVDVVENTVDGNLQCKENFPAPTGGDNVVQGNKEDQCANLSPGDIIPPETTILMGQAGTPRQGGLTISFTGNDNVTPGFLLLFECALGGAAFEVCDSPYEIPAGTEQSFQVRALDLALNADPTPATYSGPIVMPWRVYLPLVLRN